MKMFSIREIVIFIIKILNCLITNNENREFENRKFNCACCFRHEERHRLIMQGRPKALLFLEYWRIFLWWNGRSEVQTWFFFAFGKPCFGLPFLDSNKRYFFIIFIPQKHKQTKIIFFVLRDKIRWEKKPHDNLKVFFKYFIYTLLKKCCFKHSKNERRTMFTLKTIEEQKLEEKLSEKKTQFNRRLNIPIKC